MRSCICNTFWYGDLVRRSTQMMLCSRKILKNGYQIPQTRARHCGPCWPVQCAKQRHTPCNVTKHCAGHDKLLHGGFSSERKRHCTLRWVKGLALQRHQIFRMPQFCNGCHAHLVTKDCSFAMCGQVSRTQVTNYSAYQAKSFS